MYPHVLLWFVQPCFPGGGTWNPGNLLEMQLVIFSGKCDGNWVYPYHQFLSSSYGRVGCFKKPLEEWIVPGIQGQPLSLEIDWLKITSGKAARNHPHQTPLYDGSPKVNTKGAWQENGNGMQWLHHHPSVNTQMATLNSISASHPIKIFANIQSQYNTIQTKLTCAMVKKYNADFHGMPIVCLIPIYGNIA